ncbi:restriction endonuclease subunit S, partial [Mobilicoccus pelagius]
PSLDPHWLASFFNSPLGKWNVERVQYGAAQGVINLSEVASFMVPLPSREEQARRIRQLHRASENHAAMRASIKAIVEHLQEYKQSLITAAATGEFDVTTASTRIPG